MIDLRLCLEFECLACNGLVGVTVECTGSGWAGEHPRGVARVYIPCPTCGEINQVLFDPDGTVRAVRPHVACRGVVPSAN